MATPTGGGRFASLGPGFSRSNVTDVRVRMRLENGQQFRKEVILTGETFDKSLGRRVAFTAIKPVERSVGELIREMFNLRAVIGTVGKALISGFAITAVFATLFGALNTLRTIFFQLPDDILRSTSALLEMELAVQALLATTTTFSTDAQENFRLAGIAARDLRDQLIILDPQTLGGIRELQTAVQALLATGAIGLVDSADAGRELAEVASLLTNAVVLTTGRVNDQRQIFSEIKELMLGNVRSQNQVAQLIESQVGDLDQWLANIRESGNLLEELRKVLTGINEGAQEFLNTLTSIEASEEATLAVIRERAFSQQVNEIIAARRGILDRIKEEEDAIVATREVLSDIPFLWQNVSIAIRNAKVEVETFFGRILELGRAAVRAGEEAGVRSLLPAGIFEPGRLPPRPPAPVPRGVSLVPAVQEIRTEIDKLDSRVRSFAKRSASAFAQSLEPMERASFVIAEQFRVVDEEILQTLIERRQDLTDLLERAITPQDVSAIVGVLRTVNTQIMSVNQSLETFNEGTREVGRQRAAADLAQRERLILRAQVGARRDANRLVEEQERMLQNVLRLQVRIAAEAGRDQLVTANALVNLTRVRISGLERVLSVDQRVSLALRDAQERVRDLVSLARQRGGNSQLLQETEEGILRILQREADVLREQLSLQERLRARRQILRRFRLEQEGVIAPGVEPIGIRGLIRQRREAIEDLEFQRAEGASEEAMERTLTFIAAVQSELQGLAQSSVSVANIISGAMTKAFLDILEKGGSIIDFLKNVRTNLKAVGETILFAFGQAFANALQGLITGTSSFKEAIGGLIIAVGNLAVALGTILLLGSFFFGFGSIGLGVALIAAGAGMIALGAALGGSGPTLGGAAAGAEGAGQVREFAFNESEVNVQQGFVQATDNLTLATERMNAAADSFQTLPPGVVWQRGAEENGGVLNAVGKDARRGRNLQASRDLALTLSGGTRR